MSHAMKPRPFYMRVQTRMKFALIWLALFCGGSVHAAKPWQILEGCRLVESRINDGDSFRVHWKGGELTVRLYFADTPESDYRFRDCTKPHSPPMRGRILQQEPGMQQRQKDPSLNAIDNTDFSLPSGIKWGHAQEELRSSRGMGI